MLKQGMSGWEEKGYALYNGPEFENRVKATTISVREFKAMMDAKPGSFTLVDVREPDEYAEGHIPGAINIPMTNFAAAGQLAKGKKIVIYCKSGARSYTAYRKLKRQAFPDIWQITFEEWQEAGLPIEK